MPFVAMAVDDETSPVPGNFYVFGNVRGVLTRSTRQPLPILGFDEGLLHPFRESARGIVHK